MSAIPLPPELPPIIKQNDKTKAVLRIEENKESSRIKGIDEQCKRIIVDSSIRTSLQGGIIPEHWVLFNVGVRSKLQGHAPRCGIVALSMAAEMARLSKEFSSSTQLDNAKRTLNYDSDESELTALLNLAKDLSFSCEGEMFSADNLATLAHEFYSLNTEVTDSSLDEIKNIMAHLIDGNPLLVPYDAAPNHEPCLSKGHKAHWALLTGFLCAVEGAIRSDCNETHLSITINQSTSSIHILKKPESKQKKLLLNKMIPSTLHLLARQSKSHHLALWPLKLLRESNSNLFELNTNKENYKSFVLPEGGVYEGLCKKLIYLKS